jgi:hypothetical protein
MGIFSKKSVKSTSIIISNYFHKALETGVMINRMKGRNGPVLTVRAR